MPTKELIVVGGPNGAGKTTFVEESLRDRPMVYQRSLHNFWTIYRHLADEWTLMYNSSNGAIRVAYFERPQLVVQSDRLLTRYWELAGVNQ